MTLRILFVLFIAVFSVSVAEGAEQKESQNLISVEMSALDKAFKTTIDAIVLNEHGRIAPAFEEVNRIRGNVEHVLKGGAMITLPKNQKRFREFVKLDDKFHHNLEILLKAARKNNMGGVRKQTHKLLDACVRCHSVFRK